MLEVDLVRRLEGQSTMKKHLFISSTLLLVLLLAVQTPQFAQDTSARSSKADQERRMVAISLLRSINTVEVTHQTTNGSFVVWKTLVSDQPEYFDKFLAMHGLQKANAHFSDAPDILPGWNLRLNVHLDGQGYDVLLRDMTDDKCGYAALTDENGVIRQGKAIDCEI
jgi:hypothetical protein